MTPNTLLLRDYNAGGEVDSISAVWLRRHAFGAKPLELFRYPKIVILIGLQKHYQVTKHRRVYMNGTHMKTIGLRSFNALVLLGTFHYYKKTHTLNRLLTVTLD